MDTMDRCLRVTCVVALIFLSMAALPPPLQADTRVHIWVKALIPKVNPVAPNGVKQVPGTTDKWMIDGPPGTPCFMTDHRAFSDDRAASARVTTEFFLVIDASGARVDVPVPLAHVHTAGTSTEVNCQTGAIIEQKPGVFSKPHAIGSKPPEDSMGKPATAGSQSQVIFGVATVNPFAPPLISPAIDYLLDLIYDTATKKLSFKATLGQFPAYEAYAQLDNGPTVTLFRASPTTPTPWGLYDFGTGLATRAVNGTVPLQ